MNLNIPNLIDGQGIVDLADLVLGRIKNAPWFPYDTGHLKNDSTIVEYFPNGINGFSIVFDANEDPSYGANYIPFLEYGTNPHFIHFVNRGFSIYHPGSNKHVGFIRVKSYGLALKTIAETLGGTTK